MRSIERRFSYNREQIPAADFNHGGLDFYYDVVDPLWRKEKSTQQIDLWREIWHQRVKALTDIDDPRLCRPAEQPTPRYREFRGGK